MLRVGAAVTVPAVIGDVHKNLRALIGKLAHFAGKNGFVTDEDTDALVSCVKRLARSTVLEFADFFGQTSGKREQTRKGQVLAEGYEVNFVVACSPFAGGADQCGGVKDLCGRRSRGCRRGSDRTGYNPRPGLARHRAERVAKTRIVGEKR